MKMKIYYFLLSLIFVSSINGGEWIQGGLNWVAKNANPSSYVLSQQNNQLFNEASTSTNEIENVADFFKDEKKVENLTRVCKRSDYATRYICEQMKNQNTDEVLKTLNANAGNIHPLAMVLCKKYLKEKETLILYTLGTQNKDQEDKHVDNEFFTRINYTYQVSLAIMNAIDSKDIESVTTLLAEDKERQFLPPYAIQAATAYIEKIQKTSQQVLKKW